MLLLYCFITYFLCGILMFPPRHYLFVSLTCLDLASVQKHVVVRFVEQDNVRINLVLGLQKLHRVVLVRRP